MSLGSTETNTSDSEDEDVQLVMEMEPAGSNPGSRPRPLSLSSSKKLSDLCEYVSDDEVILVYLFYFISFLIINNIYLLIDCFS